MPHISLLPAPPRRVWAGNWRAPIAKPRSVIAPNTFRFLNVERVCETARDWNRDDVSYLWKYCLHYFDDLNAGDAAARRALHKDLLERWMRENPPGEGVGWESYPTSRRIVNWVMWSLDGGELSETLRANLAAQAQWLTARLEFHLLANHLLVNAKALIFAGLYCAGPQADRWLTRGLEIVDRQIDEQILEDGAHFELSPAYHALILEDLLDLVNLFARYGREIPTKWSDTIARMLDWLRAMIHPDGEIAFFNDASLEMAPSFASLSDYATRLSLSLPAGPKSALTVLHASGYVRVQNKVMALICDCARVGPDYQPGHAHADTLSFELSVHSQRILVNSGTSQYGMDAERNRQRGTAAHNTVVIDDVDSSEVWGGFRVGRRAIATLHSALSDNSTGATTIEASHDGYCRLGAGIRHRRKWIVGEGALSIEDRLEPAPTKAEAVLHVHPDVTVERIDTDSYALSSTTAGIVKLTFRGAAGSTIRDGNWHPRFGVSIANREIRATFAGPSLTTELLWSTTSPR